MPAVRGLGHDRRRRRRACRDLDRRRRQLLGRGRPRSAGGGHDRGQAGRERVRRAHPRRHKPDLQGLSQGASAGHPDRRRGGGLLLCGRHRDPPGVRRAGGGRRGPDRRERGAAGTVPDGGLDRAAAATDPLDGRHGDAHHRRADLGPARLRGGPGGPRRPGRHRPGASTRDRSDGSPATVPSPFATSRRRFWRPTRFPNPRPTPASPSWGWRWCRRATPKRVPAPSSRSASPTSPAVDRVSSPLLGPSAPGRSG